jgi:predicted MPP superfamily phosphohydrolase
MKIFFIVFVSIFSYFNYLVARYYANAFSLAGKTHFLYWAFNIFATITIFAAPYVYRVYPEKNPGFFYNALQWCGYFFFGVYSILFLFVFLNATGLYTYSKIADVSEERRDFLKTVLAGLSLSATGLMSVAGIFEARMSPVVKRVKVALHDLPDEFVGTTILQMSDVHVGQTIKKDFVDVLVKMSNEIKPDIVVLTGDLIDGLHSQLAHELVSFKDIHAPLGRFMVPGNHEYYWGVDHWINHWQQLGFSTLINEHKLITKNNSQIAIGGVHDYSARHVDGALVSSPELAFKEVPSAIKKILLAHQPKSIYDAAKAGVDLQISGHTHSGQYFPFNLLIYFFQPYVKGLHRHEEKMWIYVNQGTGYWGPPTRFGVPPEITLLELIKAPVA